MLYTAPIAHIQYAQPKSSLIAQATQEETDNGGTVWTVTRELISGTSRNGVIKFHAEHYDQSVSGVIKKDCVSPIIEGKSQCSVNN